jgi:glycosyltransferase involved in cell wall biosynthesis
MRKIKSQTELQVPSRERARFVGYVDHIAKEMVGGWVVNLEAPGEKVELEVLFGPEHTPLGEGVTAHSREDIAFLYDGAARAGFLIPIDVRPMRKGAAAMRVRVKGSEFVLPFVDGLVEPTSGEIKVGLSDSALNTIDNNERVLRALGGNSSALALLNNEYGVCAKVDPGIGNVFLINGAKDMASERFRTFGAASALRRLGFTPLIYDVDDIPRLNTGHILACVFVRVAANETVARFIAQLKRENVKVLSDFDDLVFRPSLMHKIDGVRFLSASEKQLYREGMLQYREMLQQSDLALVTTESLAAEVAEAGGTPFVVRNYPLESARAAAAALPARKAWPLQFTIGYYSGTLTHQKDFRQCAAALAAFLRRYSDARLRIVGKLDLTEFPEFSSLTGQIDHVDFMSYENMIADMAVCSIVIAPLEVGNEFCESKSELKFFDAALTGTPLIASPTETFKGVIQNRVNGFLAGEPAEWARILEDCYIDRQLMEACGTQARQTVEATYGLGNQAEAYQAALHKVGVRGPFLKVPKSPAADAVARAKPASSKTKRLKTLGVLLPDIMIGSGGHRKVLTFCREYTRQGGKVEVCFMSSKSDDELRSIVHTYYYRDCGEIRAYRETPPGCDVAVATSWPTAYEVREWQDAAKQYYFVQDFEPLFSPMSSQYAQALHSYRLGLQLITFGRWNAQKLKKDLGLESTVIDFPVDREIYFPNGATRRRQLLFYARPSQPRRLYELGLAAIDLVRPYAPGWEFLLFGETIDLQGRSGVQSLGRITDLSELSRLYSQASLGLAFSSTNPSLIPFEMLSCGLPLIDVDLGYESVDFEGCEAILRCEPTPKAIARKIFSVTTKEQELQDLSDKAVEWTSKLPTETVFATSVLKALDLV